MEEHDNNLRMVLKRLEDLGITLNSAKCAYGLTSVTFLGHRIDEQGIHPDEKHLEAIRNFPVPNDKTAVRSFIGLATFLARFVPHLSTLLQSLRHLMKKEVVFRWGETQRESFERVKQLLISPPVLVIFDPNKPTTISAVWLRYSPASGTRGCIYETCGLCFSFSDSN